MSIVIKNVDVITLESAGTILNGADIVLEGATIRMVGEAPPDFPAEEIIDGTNHVAVPGFFNAHCHAPMTFERGYAEDLPLDRWFNERGFPESGEIAPGRAADITLFDTDKPHLYPRHNRVANIGHSARGSDVSHMIVAGRLLMRDGELLTLDVERIMAEADSRARRMVSKPMRQMLQYQG